MSSLFSKSTQTLCSMSSISNHNMSTNCYSLLQSVAVSKHGRDHVRRKHPPNRQHHPRPPAHLPGPMSVGERWLQNGRDVEKRPALSGATNRSDVSLLAADENAPTENSSATPVHRESPFCPPKSARSAYDSRVPNGVDALKAAKCRLHSATGREVESKDVVSARAVGARM